MWASLAVAPFSFFAIQLSCLRHGPGLGQRTRVIAFYRARGFFRLGFFAPFGLVFFVGRFARVIGTHQHAAGLEVFFQQIRAAALRARLGHWLVRRCELALGIVGAAVERVAATAGFLLHQLAFFIQRALYPDEILLDVLALRISAARDELAVASVAQDQIAAALRAGFFQRDVWHALALIEPARGLAIRISSTCHELAEASALQDHHASAVVAIFFLRR